MNIEPSEPVRLPRAFYARDPRQVARELLGKLLVRRASSIASEEQAATGLSAGQIVAGRIVEVEAYLGADDPGAHAYHGMTPRNAVLFGPPGHLYVYFIYGNHYCTNVSCQPEGDAGCVLLRALEPVAGLEQMARWRGLEISADPTRAELRRLTSGPGKLSEALAITRPRDNQCDLCDEASSLYIASDGTPLPEFTATPRINVHRAPHDLWRFVIPGNPFASGPRTVTPAVRRVRKK